MRGWLRQTAGGLPKTFWYLWTGILINRAGAFAILFLSLYLTGPRHLTPAAAGVVVGGFGVGGAAGTLLGGVLADRWGRRRTLLLGYAGAGILMYALGLATALPLIAALTGLVGAFTTMTGPAAVAAIVDVVPEADRTRAFNLQFWAFNLGTAAASLIAGLVAEVSFTLLFVIDGSATLVAALLVLAKVPESLPAGHVEAPAGHGIRTALTDRIFLAFVGLTLIQAVLYAQSSTILPLSMKADHLPPAGYGLVISLGAVLIVLGQLFVPALIQRRRKGSVLALATALLAVGYGSVRFVDVLPGYLAAAVVWTAGSMLAAPPNAAVIAELAPPTIRARYQAVFFLTFSLAAFLAPALGGLSFQEFGPWHWLVCAGLGLAASAGHLAASGPRERRVAATRADELVAA
ncbi:MAG: MFS transporter [Actinobacteria bacterium]|nr:MAG: MFS transporter [Actinomycetota bacterium]